MTRFSQRAGLFLLFLALLAGCASGAGTAIPAAGSTGTTTTDALAPLALPPLTPVSLDGRKLQVVATTSIIGDVIANVGGDAIALTTLMAPGQDPHSYQPGAGELTAASSADVVFLNGWDLEETLVKTLQAIAADKLLVPISAGITPLPFSAPEEGHGTADPHVWMDVANVEQWTRTAEQVLSALDPANASTYAANAAAYQAELAALQTAVQADLATIPADKRVLVTNHDSLGYFARAYGFDILGTVIPAASTLAEPSARDLSQLVADMEERGVCSIFAETTVSDTLARTAAAELQGCDTVQVQSLYTGALGPAGSGADSYVGMMKADVDTIVSGLR